MKTLLILSWRNIWRHPGRSSALLAAIISGLWAGALTIAISNGIYQQRTNYLINNETTHLQIHHPDFMTERSPDLTIPQPEVIVSRLAQDPRVRSFSPRTLIDGMLQSPVKASGVRIRGIDIVAETATTGFHRQLSAGRFLDQSTRNPLVMGQALAATHNMEIGNRVVLVFEDTRHELTAAAFTIVGLFVSPSRQVDRTLVFVRADDLSSLLADRFISHEIVILLHDIADADTVAADLNTRFNGISARTWFELSPELRTLIDYGSITLLLLTTVIMLALAFGILNTLLMSLFERRYELGMLLCIGMGRGKLFVMMMLEALMLTLSGAAAGLLLAAMALNWLSSTGVDLGIFAAGLAQIGYDRIIYPFLHGSDYATVVFMVIFTTLAAALYPAWKALATNPLEASKSR